MRDKYIRPLNEEDMWTMAPHEGYWYNEEAVLGAVKWLGIKLQGQVRSAKEPREAMAYQIAGDLVLTAFKPALKDEEEASRVTEDKKYPSCDAPKGSYCKKHGVTHKKDERGVLIGV